MHLCLISFTQTRFLVLPKSRKTQQTDFGTKWIFGPNTGWFFSLYNVQIKIMIFGRCIDFWGEVRARWLLCLLRRRSTLVEAQLVGGARLASRSPPSLFFTSGQDINLIWYTVEAGIYCCRWNRWRNSIVLLPQCGIHKYITDRFLSLLRKKGQAINEINFVTKMFLLLSIQISDACGICEFHIVEAKQ